MLLHESNPGRPVDLDVTCVHGGVILPSGTDRPWVPPRSSTTTVDERSRSPTQGVYNSPGPIRTYASTHRQSRWRRRPVRGHRERAGLLRRREHTAAVQHVDHRRRKWPLYAERRGQLAPGRPRSRLGPHPRYVLPSRFRVVVSERTRLLAHRGRACPLRLATALFLAIDLPHVRHFAAALSAVQQRHRGLPPWQPRLPGMRREPAMRLEDLRSDRPVVSGRLQQLLDPLVTCLRALRPPPPPVAGHHLVVGVRFSRWRRLRRRCCRRRLLRGPRLREPSLGDVTAGLAYGVRPLPRSTGPGAVNLASPLDPGAGRPAGPTRLAKGSPRTAGPRRHLVDSCAHPCTPPSMFS